MAATTGQAGAKLSPTEMVLRRGFRYGSTWSGGGSNRVSRENLVAAPAARYFSSSGAKMLRMTAMSNLGWRWASSRPLVSCSVSVNCV